ncbi:MAG: hypothetical protein AAB036_08005 [Elusimicrobiota bacterium]
MRLAVSLLTLLTLAGQAQKSQPYGILLLAHGGNSAWDKNVEQLRARADARVPTELALGMADAAALQRGVDRLAARGIKKIIAVPLFVLSRSEVLDQTRFALGLREKPSEVLRDALAALPHGHGSHGASGHRHSFSTASVRLPLPLEMTPALDDDPLVSRILRARARALSSAPSRETVILVAHGPVDDAALPAWQGTLSTLAGRLKSEGGFRGVSYALLRDDAPAPVRSAAVADFRAQVSAASKSGKALVVPLLIAQGGIENKIPRDLAGLEYSWNAKTLMPDDRFAAWVLARAAAAAQ